MAKKNEKNCHKDNTTNTTVQPSKNYKNEAEECKHEQTNKSDSRNYR